MQHQPFATCLGDGVELAQQFGAVAHAPLFDRLDIRCIDMLCDAFDPRHALGEIAVLVLRIGQLEHHVFDLFPRGIVGLLIAHDADHAFKLSAPDPQLTIKRYVG